ncbi:hypothetical protein M9H77_28037 [Catharanthus roseus]|uniref:Uncharacterized protein n=1 Tax=Catharanthus roseus TaxID=4058 RepID=A0ACC0AEK2_CATRO|nr:hypothetical protein M9H77_28037 [Catharanthus roseus]
MRAVTKLVRWDSYEKFVHVAFHEISLNLRICNKSGHEATECLIIRYPNLWIDGEKNARYGSARAFSGRGNRCRGHGHSIGGRVTASGGRSNANNAPGAGANDTLPVENTATLVAADGQHACAAIRPRMINSSENRTGSKLFTEGNSKHLSIS